eukprot:166468_1
MSNTQPLVANDADSTTTNVYGSVNPKAGSIPMTDDDDKYAGDFEDEFEDDNGTEQDQNLGYYDADVISFKINKTKIKLKDDDLNEMYPHLNFELKIDDKQIYKGYGLCHEEYVDENDEIQQISGFCRIMIDEDHDVNLPKSIKYRFGTNKEWSETISYPPDTTNGWNYTEQKMVCKEIKEQKRYAKNELEIYQENIRIYLDSDAFPIIKQAKQLLKGGIDDWKKADISKAGTIKVFASADERIKIIQKKTNLVLCTKVHDMQIYVDNFEVYGVENETAKNSATFCGEDFLELFYALDYKDDRDEEYHPFYYQNITEPLYICSRYRWIKDKCLYGQDEEFNVFRGLCFVSPANSEEAVSKLSVGILCIILQCVLAVGIVYEVYRNWDVSMFDDPDPMIMIIAVLVFSFISHTYLATVDCFYKFYIHMHYVCYIPWGIIILDFISNILIGLTICMISFFYLLQSDTISDAVLNSFALTFIIELDDIANYFEKDEDALMEADWDNLKLGPISGDWNGEIKKRSITLLPKLCSKPTFTLLYSVLGSPLYIFPALYRILHKTIDFVKTRNGSFKYHSD